MGKITDKVAVVGMGCTKFDEHWDKSIEDLAVEAAYEAFEDAGVSSEDIEAAWWGTVDGGELGRTLGRFLKLEYIPITRVENRCATGSDAFRNACFAVAAGVYDVVLALGAEKLKDSGMASAGFDPRQPYTSRIDTIIHPPAAFAQLARRYQHHYGLTYDELKRALGLIAVKNHHNGSLNPKAQFQQEITLERAINAPMVAHPLGLFDCCGVSDGAAAAILTRPEIARRMREDYVLVKGIGQISGSFQNRLRSDFDLVHLEEVFRSGRDAYEQAGIRNPRRELDLAIVHDCFTITEMVIYEDLGFSQRGKAREDIEEGVFTLEGEIPVNTDGGLKCFGHPLGASGLRMLYEVYKQLQDRADRRQIKNARLGLAHAFGGTPVDSGVSTVIILGRRD
jgi:acetyl-CoA C-acetyltransferase